MRIEYVYLLLAFLLVLWLRARYHDWMRRNRWWDWYGIYLRSFHWQFHRWAKLLVYGYRCQRCKTSRGPIQIHHKHYRSLGHEKIIGFDDTIPLCIKCHRKEDSK